MAFAQWMGLAVAAAVLCMVVRAQQPQMASLVSIAAGIILLLSALSMLGDVQGVFARLTALSGLGDSYLQTLLKVLGVSYASELSAQICQDLGEGGLAVKVSLAGKLCVFTLTAPLMLSMLEMILELAP